MVFFAAGTAAAANMPAGDLLDGVLFVESRGNHAAVGRRGERGGYQFRKTTWQDRTASPFRLAHNPEVARTVAEWHYNWIKSTLEAEGIAAPSDWQIAAAWNCGASAVAAGRIPNESRIYANRVLVAAVTAREAAAVTAARLNPPRFLLSVADSSDVPVSVARTAKVTPQPLFSIIDSRSVRPQSAGFVMPPIGMAQIRIN